MDPEDKNYVCTLDEYSLEKAKRELFEDPKQRLGAVKTLRDWIRTQPHLCSRTDTEYLLQVLRTAKFSQLRAREIIETILTLKTKHPDYLLKLDTQEPGIKTFIENGSTMLLPKTDREGRSVMVRRVELVDLSNPLSTLINELRSMLAVQELMRDGNEKVVVSGTVIFVDMSGLSVKYLSRLTNDMSSALNAAKVFQDANTGRLKAMHFYNAGALVELLMTLVKTLFKKKFADRMHIHETMESIYKVLPKEILPDEYLPDDYKGPSAGPMNDLIADLKRRLMEPGFRARLLEYSSDKYRIDEKKKDKSIPQESFRRLNID